MTATQTPSTKTSVTAANPFATRDQLVLEHMDLVRAIAGQVRRGLAVHIEMDDLMHAGMMGLIDAAARYEEGKEVPFTVYAKHRIRGSVLDSLRQADWATRKARQTYKQVEEVTRELGAKLNRRPTQDEIGEAMGLTTEELHRVMGEYRNLREAAIRTRAIESEDGLVREIPAAAEQSPEALCARSEMSKRVASAVGSLPERYRQILKMYYEGDLTMKEIGKVMGVKESRVSQMHKMALEKIELILTHRGIAQTAGFAKRQSA